MRINRSRVKELYKEGKTDVQIAEALGTSQPVIHNIRKNQLKLEAHRKQTIKEFIEKLTYGFLFTKDVDISKRNSFGRIFSSSNGRKNIGLIYKVSIPKISFPGGMPNMRIQTIYYRKGAEELMFENYLLRLPIKSFRYLMTCDSGLAKRRFNIIRSYFNLPKIQEVDKFRKKMIISRKF